MSVNTNMTHYLENNPVEKLHSELARLMAQISHPKWIVAKDKLTEAMDEHYRQAFGSIGTVVNVPPVPAPVYSEPVMVWDHGRVCYHCDTTDGVSGVVPLCRKCR